MNCITTRSVSHEGLSKMIDETKTSLKTAVDSEKSALEENLATLTNEANRRVKVYKSVLDMIG